MECQALYALLQQAGRGRKTENNGFRNSQGSYLLIKTWDVRPGDIGMAKQVEAASTTCSKFSMKYDAATLNWTVEHVSTGQGSPSLRLKAVDGSNTPVVDMFVATNSNPREHWLVRVMVGNDEPDAPAREAIELVASHLRG